MMFPDFKNAKVMKSGEAFGEIALVTYAKRYVKKIYLSKRTATILAREDTEFATITRGNF